MRTIFITENQHKRFQNLLTESLSRLVYHFCSLDAGLHICRDNEIKLSATFAKQSEKAKRKDNDYYLSLTRQRNSQFGYSRKFSEVGVRIELDGEKLNNNFRGEHVNYWARNGRQVSDYE